MLAHQLIHFVMRDAVLGFLADKIRDTLLQLRVLDLIAEQADTLNKIALAVWKGQAQRVIKGSPPNQ